MNVGIYKIELNVRKYLRVANNEFELCKFLACIELASDWLKNNQLLSQLTHAHYRDSIP